MAASRFLGSRQYHVALAGNALSARITDGLWICTRHGADKEALKPGDVVLCDRHGRKLKGAGDPTCGDEHAPAGLTRCGRRSDR